MAAKDDSAGGRITVTTQVELDAAVRDHSADGSFVVCEGGTAARPLVARDSSHVEAWGSSHVVARDSSHVEARDSSHVVAWDSSHVVARDSSHVEARDSSHVEAWGSSHVVARDSSHVEARDSSHVEARDSSHVVAWGEVAVHVQSNAAEVSLFGCAVAIAVAAAKIRKRSKTAVVVLPKRERGSAGWLDREGVKPSRGTVVVYKRVSISWLTQEGTARETAWTPSTSLQHPAWAPETGECGPGKFHACSRPYFCDEFRSERGDRYVAIAVKVADLRAWDGGSYPHKVAFRAGTVLYECDRYGTRVETTP